MARTAAERMSGRYGKKDTPAPKEEKAHPDTPAPEKASENGAGKEDIKDAGRGSMSDSERKEPDAEGGMETRHMTERKMMASRHEGERRDMHNTHRDEHRAMEKRHDAEIAEAY